MGSIIINSNSSSWGGAAAVAIDDDGFRTAISSAQWPLCSRSTVFAVFLSAKKTLMPEVP